MTQNFAIFHENIPKTLQKFFFLLLSEMFALLRLGFNLFH